MAVGNLALREDDSCLLVVGVFLVGVIRVFIQPEWIQLVAGSNTLLANLAGVVFGVFMYFPTLVEVPIAKMFLSFSACTPACSSPT